MLPTEFVSLPWKFVLVGTVVSAEALGVDMKKLAHRSTTRGIAKEYHFLQRYRPNFCWPFFIFLFLFPVLTVAFCRKVWDKYTPAYAFMATFSICLSASYPQGFDVAF